MGEKSLCKTKFISAVWNIRTCLPYVPCLPQIITGKTYVFSWGWNHFIYLPFSAKISLFHFNSLNTLILLSQVIQHLFFHLWDYNSHKNFLLRNACLIFSLFSLSFNFKQKLMESPTCLLCRSRQLRSLIHFLSHSSPRVLCLALFVLVPQEDDCDPWMHTLSLPLTPVMWTGTFWVDSRR